MSSKPSEADFNRYLKWREGVDLHFVGFRIKDSGAAMGSVQVADFLAYTEKHSYAIEVKMNRGPAMKFIRPEQKVTLGRFEKCISRNKSFVLYNYRPKGKPSEMRWWAIPIEDYLQLEEHCTKEGRKGTIPNEYIDIVPHVEAVYKEKHSKADGSHFFLWNFGLFLV